MTARLLVGRGRAYEDELPDLAGKEAKVAFYVVGSIGYPVDDNIELPVMQDCGHLAGPADIGGQVVNTRNFGSPYSPVEMIKIHALCNRQTAHGSADGSGAADKQNFHGDPPSGKCR